MIFYFSGTGNTRWAAQRLSDVTGEELVYMPEHVYGTFTQQLQPDERIGFCFPVHGWRPPKLVRDFISRLSLDTQGHYVYALCTAGDNIGETIDILADDLKKVGIHLDSAFSLIMPESYVGLPFMDVDKDKKELQKKAKAATDLEAFLQDILNRKKGVWRLVKGHWPRINSRLLGAYFTNHLITDRPFHVDSQRCVKCGICAEVCPVHDIIGGLGYEPQWRHDGSCLTCFTCYHHCPHHAIEYGRQTKHKGQYFFNRRKLTHQSENKTSIK